jgi:hypothetical protein
MAPTQRTSISEHFATLTDPRAEQGKDHLLVDILTITLCAVICGRDDCVEVATDGETKETWLRTFLPLPNGIASHDTFGRVFRLLDPDELRRCFLGWVRAVVGESVASEGGSSLGQPVVAVDGKTLASTWSAWQRACSQPRPDAKPVDCELFGHGRHAWRGHHRTDIVPFCGCPGRPAAFGIAGSRPNVPHRGLALADARGLGDRRRVRHDQAGLPGAGSHIRRVGVRRSCGRSDRGRTHMARDPRSADFQ